MSWRLLWFKLISLPISVWAMASLIFFLSRLLPQTMVPKGMEELESNLFHTSSQQALNQISSDYQHRMGLDLPLFYVRLTNQATKAAVTQKPLPKQLLWLSKLMQWHEEKAVLAFYHHWKHWGKQPANTQGQPVLEEILLNYSQAQQLQERQSLQAQFSEALAKTAQKPNETRSSLLGQSWQQMVSTTASFTVYFPVITWNGKSNQYHQWFKQILHGNFGVSARDYRPVYESISAALQTSGAIALLGFCFSVLSSFTLGLLLTLYPLAWWNSPARQTLYLLDSIPAFLLALGILALFLAGGGTLSSPLYVPQNQPALPLTASHWLASLCVWLFLLPYVTLQIYQNLAHEQRQDYMKTAYAKGLSPAQALLQHALPTILPGLLVILSEILISLVAGILVVEITFSLPGVGSLLTQSILSRDYNLLIGLTLMLLTFRLVTSWCTDLISLLLDPRIRIS